MSSLESFGKLLHETVSGEKLSASKVERVRDAAAEHFNHASKVCAIILKVHRKAAPRSRLSSLYLFDGTCRHAADIIRKKGSGFDYRDAEPPSDSRAQPGTKQALTESASGFIFSASGIVEEIVLTTMQDVREDQKPKVTKVVDIWIKAGTFDKGLLNDIKDKLNTSGRPEDETRRPTISTNIPTTSNKGTRLSDQEATQDATSIGSPYGMLMQDSEPPKQSNTPPQVPVNLLALLGGGSKANTASNTQANGNGTKGSNAPGLDASQVAMLQQIAQNREGPNAATSIGTTATQQVSHSDRTSGPPPSLPRSTPSAPPASEARSSYPVASNTAPAAVPPPPTNKMAATNTGFSFVPDQSIGDLSQFNFTLFDPTSALHWVQFAQHWHNTYQYVPSNQECLWAMMSAIQSQSYMAAHYDNSSW